MSETPDTPDSTKHPVRVEKWREVSEPCNEEHNTIETEVWVEFPEVYLEPDDEVYRFRY